MLDGFLDGELKLWGKWSVARVRLALALCLAEWVGPVRYASLIGGGDQIGSLFWMILRLVD